MRDPFRWLFAALSVSLGASLFWGVQQRRELNRARLAAAADRQAFTDMEDRLGAHEKARIATDANLQAQAGPSIRRIFPEGRSVPAPEVVDKFNAAVDTDPVWEPFFRSLERRRVLSRYNLLLAALAIPRDKLAPLEDLLVERAIASRKIVHQLRSAGKRADSPDSIAAVSQATDEVDARIEKVVGGEVARKLKEWNSAIYSYGNIPDGPVAQDAVTLREAGFELSTDQLVKLALIRYEVTVLSPEARPGSKGDLIDPNTGITPLEMRLFAREADVLSADEVAVLRKWTTEEHRARAALDALKAKFHIEGDRPAH
jgi:hypothetical protein